jgi:hypothetical protein
MVLAAHWLNLHWPISSLPVLALQCVVAGIIFLAVASMVVISKDERRRVIRGLTGLYSKRSKKRMPAPVAARQE